MIASCFLILPGNKFNQQKQGDYSQCVHTIPTTPRAASQPFQPLEIGQAVLWICAENQKTWGILTCRSQQASPISSSTDIET
jgi:hypothetical protein